MYVKYCENKPKSEFIVAEHFDFFEVRDGECALLTVFTGVVCCV